MAAYAGLSVGFRHVWAFGKVCEAGLQGSVCMRDQEPVGKGLTLRETECRDSNLGWRSEES